MVYVALSFIRHHFPSLWHVKNSILTHTLLHEAPLATLFTSPYVMSFPLLFFCQCSLMHTNEEELNAYVIFKLLIDGKLDSIPPNTDYISFHISSPVTNGIKKASSEEWKLCPETTVCVPGQAYEHHWLTYEAPETHKKICVARSIFLACLLAAVLRVAARCLHPARNKYGPCYS